MKYTYFQFQPHDPAWRMSLGIKSWNILLGCCAEGNLDIHLTFGGRAISFESGMSGFMVESGECDAGWFAFGFDGCIEWEVPPIGWFWSWQSLK